MKKGPQRNASSKSKASKRFYRDPDILYRDIIQDLKAKPFHEERYQQLLMKYKPLIPHPNNSTFHTLMFQFLIKLSHDNLLPDDSTQENTHTHLNQMFYIIMAHRALFDCNEVGTVFRNEYLYLLWHSLSHYLVPLTQNLVSNSLTLEQKNTYTHYLNQCDYFFQHGIAEFEKYLTDLPNSKKPLDIGVRKSLFIYYKNLGFYQMNLSQFLLDNQNIEGATLAYNKALSYCDYINNNFDYIIEISGASAVKCRNVSLTLQEGLNSLALLLKISNLNLDIPISFQPFVEFDIITDRFKEMLAEFIETDELMSRSEFKPNPVPNSSSVSAPLEKRLKDLTSLINQPNEETDKTRRFLSDDINLVWQTQSLLRDIQKSPDKITLQSNLSAALMLIISWRKIFTTSASPEANEIVTNYITPLSERITLSLKRMMQAQAAMLSNENAEFNLIIEDASNIRASKYKEKYQDFIVRHIEKLGNKHFVLPFLTKAVTHLQKLVPTSPLLTGIESIDEHFEKIEKRVNALQCILVATSLFMSKKVAIQYLLTLWSDLRSIFENTANIFKSDKIPSEYTACYINRVYNLSFLLDHYAEQFEPILQELAKVEKSQPSYSLALVYKNFSYIASTQKDYGTAIPALKSSYQYYAKFEQKVRETASKGCNEQIENFTTELSTLFFEIYSPMFSQDTLYPFLLKNPEFPSFVKLKDRVEFLTRIQNTFTFSEDDASKTLRNHLYLTQCLDNINTISKAHPQRARLFDGYKKLLAQNTAMVTAKANLLFETPSTQPFNRIKPRKKYKPSTPVVTCSSSHAEIDLPVPSSSHDTEPLPIQITLPAHWDEPIIDEGPWIEVRSKKSRVKKQPNSANKQSVYSSIQRREQNIQIKQLTPAPLPASLTPKSSKLSPHRSYAQAVKGVYQPLNENENLSASVIKNDPDVSMNDPVEQLTSQMGSLSLAVSASPVSCPVLPTRIALPTNLFEIYCRLRNAGHLVLFTGGFIRDTLLGIPHNDIDIITTCSIAELPSIFNGYGYANPNRNDLYHLHDYIDIISYPSVNLMGSAHLRDLTVNAFYCDHQFIYDPLNIADTLNSPFLFLLGDPNERLAKDPSLILRLTRFFHTLQKGLTAEYLQLMKTHAPKITSLPWGVLKSNINALFLRDPVIAAQNLNFLYEQRLISYLLSEKSEEEEFYRSELPTEQRICFFERVLENIYRQTDKSQFIEILTLLLSLRLSKYTKANDLSLAEGIEQSANLLLQLISVKAKKKNEYALKDHLSSRINYYHLFSQSPEFRGIRLSSRAFTPMYGQQQQLSASTSDNMPIPAPASPLPVLRQGQKH